jgi:hypothetical protein
MIFETNRDLLNNINLLVFTKEKRPFHTERIHGDILFYIQLTPLPILR